VGVLPLSGTEPWFAHYIEARSEHDMEALKAVPKKFVLLNRSGCNDEEMSQFDKEAAATVSPSTEQAYCGWAQPKSWRLPGPCWPFALAFAPHVACCEWTGTGSIPGIRRRSDSSFSSRSSSFRMRRPPSRALDRLKSDPDAIEHEAREKLHSPSRTK